MSISTFTRVSLKTFLGTALAVGVLLSAPSAFAASQCKGLIENACANDAACSWVEGYTRKDGRTVSSHCRTKRNSETAKKSDGDSLQLSKAN